MRRKDSYFHTELFVVKKKMDIGIFGGFMDMKIVKSEKKICPCCMEEHVVKTVLVMDHATFKNTPVNYEASYFFCDLAKEFYMDEQQMRDNNIKLKDAYRKRMNLNAAALK